MQARKIGFYDANNTRCETRNYTLKRFATGKYIEKQ